MTTRGRRLSELLRGGLGGHEAVLKLVAWKGKCPGNWVLLVLHHPGEELDGGGKGTEARSHAGGRAHGGGRPGDERVPDRRRHEQRSEQVRAAALVLLRPLLTVLVRPDGDVLGTVVLGEIRPPQGDRCGADGERSGEDLLGCGRKPAPADEADGGGATDHRHGNRGPLEGELCARKPTADLGEKREDLGHARRPAHETVLDLCGAQGLEP
jgi:hypothetical protein